ncbi:hypothetical protein F5B20DRAFT_534380, partial [Whalleya microplaca]
MDFRLHYPEHNGRLLSGDGRWLYDLRCSKPRCKPVPDKRGKPRSRRHFPAAVDDYCDLGPDCFPALLEALFGDTPVSPTPTDKRFSGYPESNTRVARGDMLDGMGQPIPQGRIWLGWATKGPNNDPQPTIEPGMGPVLLRGPTVWASFTKHGVLLKRVNTKVAIWSTCPARDVDSEMTPGSGRVGWSQSKVTNIKHQRIVFNPFFQGMSASEVEQWAGRLLLLDPVCRPNLGVTPTAEELGSMRRAFHDLSRNEGFGNTAETATAPLRHLTSVDTHASMHTPGEADDRMCPMAVANLLTPQSPTGLRSRAILAIAHV